MKEVNKERAGEINSFFEKARALDLMSMKDGGREA